MRKRGKKLGGISRRLSKSTRPGVPGVQTLSPPVVVERDYGVSLDELWVDTEKLCKLTRRRLIFNNCGGLPAPAVGRGARLARIYHKLGFGAD